MTRQKLLRVIIPLLVALIVTLLVARLGQTRSTATVPILVAQSLIARGSVITGSEVHVEQVSKSQAWPDSLGNVAEAVGQVAQVNISPGSPVVMEELQAAQTAGLSYDIPAHERAMTIAVTTVSGIAGNLESGSHVDIIATYPYQSGAGGVPGSPLSATVVQNLVVLQVGQSSGNGQSTGGSNYSLVTVSVTPVQATEISLAEQLGTIDLVLRPSSGAGSGMASTTIGGLPR